MPTDEKDWSTQKDFVVVQWSYVSESRLPSVTGTKPIVFLWRRHLFRLPWIQLIGALPLITNFEVVISLDGSRSPWIQTYNMEYCKSRVLRTSWGFHGGIWKPVRTSQETHFSSATETSRLMLVFWDIKPQFVPHRKHGSATEINRLMLCKIWGFHCDAMWLL
jgi:hypothetical protein